jgi:predicted Zn-dependent peptidase
MYVMVPLPQQKHYAKSMALGHWQAAHLSASYPNEPRFYAHFHDQVLTISSTFPSSHIESAISSLIQKMRQSPLNSEPMWSSDALERSRREALMRLSLTNQRAEDKALILDRRLATAFGDSPLPLVLLRQRKLKEISSFELMGWFRQNIQSQPVYIVISGDVNERRLYQALSPLNQAEVPPPAQPLHLSPLKNVPTKLRRCRELHISRDQGDGVINLSYRLPPEIQFAQIRLLESALSFSTHQSSLPRSFYVQRNHSPTSALNPTLSIQIRASADELKQSWEEVKKRIKLLKQRPLSRPQLQKLKKLTLATELGEMELSAKRSAWFAYGWFMGWQSSSMKGFDDWSKELDVVTASQLHKVAQAVLQDDQRRIVVISSPKKYSEVSEKCQRVSP